MNLNYEIVDNDSTSTIEVPVETETTFETESTKNKPQLKNAEQAAQIVTFNDNAKGIPTRYEDVSRSLDVGDTSPVYSSYLATKMAEIDTARQHAITSAFGGDATKTEFFINYEKQQRDIAAAEQKLFSQYFNISKDAYEQSLGVGSNGIKQPEKIDSAGNAVATSLTMEQWFGKLTDEALGKTFGSKAVSFGSMLGVQIIPLVSGLQNFAQVPSIIADVTDQPRQRSAEQAVLETRRFLAGLDKEEQQIVLKTIYDSIATKTHDAYAWTVIASLIDDQLPHGDEWYSIKETPAFLSWTEKLEGVGLVLDLTVIGGMLSRFIKTAVSRGKLIRVIKETEGAKTAAELAVETITKGDKANIGLTKEEALNLARSNSINNIIGTSLQGVSSSMSQRIVGDTTALIEGLRSVLFSSGKTQDEVAASIKESLKFVKEANPHILSVSPVEIGERGATIQIVHGTNTGQAFATREAAEEFAKQLGGVTKVIELKSNAGFGVTVDKITVLEAEVDALRKLTSTNVEIARNAAKNVGAISGNKINNLEYNAIFNNLESPPTARQVVLSIATGSKNEMLRKVASRILDNPNINLDAVQFGPMRKPDESGLGVYRYLEDSIGTERVLPDEATALHEIIHSVTSQVIDSVRNADKYTGIRKIIDKSIAPRQATAVRNLDLVFRGITQSDKVVSFMGQRVSLKTISDYGLDVAALENSKDFGKYYGFTNVNEMVAEALTNKEFAKVLHNVKLSEILDEAAVRAIGGKNKSVWDALTEWFVDLLGGSKKEQTALQAVLENSWKLVDTVNEDQRTLIKDLFSKKLLTKEDMSSISLSKNSKPHITLKKGKMLQSLLEMKEKELSELKALKGEAFQGYVVAQVKEDPTVLSKVGGFDPMDVASMNRIVGFDDKHLASELLVNQYTAALHLTSANRKLLSNYAKNIIGSLSTKEKNALISVLTEGDAASDIGGVGKEFGIAELRQKWIDQFNDAQIEKLTEAYLRTRVLRNVVHDIKDQAAVRTLKSRGYNKQIQYSVDGVSYLTGAGKIIDDITTLRGGVVFDAIKNEHVVVDDAYIKAHNTANVTVFELSEPIYTNNKWTRKIITDEIEHSEIRSVIPRRPGEFQRIYDAPFFIRLVGSKNIDGVVSNSMQAIRTAMDYKEGEKYVAALNKVLKLHKDGVLTVADVSRLVGKWEDSASLYKRIAEGEFSWADTVSISVSRSEDEYVNNFVDAVSSNGLLFKSSRGEKLRAIEGEGVKNTLSVMDSLSAELSSVSRLAAVYELRASSIQRWHNFGVATNSIPSTLQKMSPEDAFVAFRKERLSYLADSQEKIFTKRAWQYINEQLGVKSAHELKVEELQNYFASKLLTKDAGRIRTSVGMWLRQSSGIDDLRTVVTHMNLGTGNVGQLFVQAASAATATILHPVYGMFAAKTATLARIALMFDNPAMWKKIGVMDSITSLGLESVDEFVDLVKAIKKSGIISGIQSTSLYTKEDGAFNILSKTKRVLSEGSLFFFNRGEEFSRLVSFDIARRVIKAKGGKNPLDDFTLREIVALEDDFTQNMTKGNQAFYTKGLWSVPLQYMQFFLKFGGNIFGAVINKNEAYRGFTKMEAAKLITGYTVLYGLSNGGLPDIVEEVVGEEVVKQIASSANITDPKDLYNLRLTLSEGIIAGAINMLSEATTGESTRIAVGTRLGVFNWADDWAGYLIDNDKTFTELLMGASYRTVKAMGSVFAPFLRMYWINDEVSPQVIASDLIDIATTSSSQFNNFQKWWLWKNNENKLISTTGAYIAPLTSTEVFAKLISFSSVPEIEYYKLRKDERKYKKSVEENIGKFVAQQRVRIIASHNAGDVDMANKLQARLDRMMPQRNTVEWEIVDKYLERTKADWKPALQKEMAKLAREKWGNSSKNVRPFMTTTDESSVIPQRREQ